MIISYLILVLPTFLLCVAGIFKHTHILKGREHRDIVLDWLDWAWMYASLVFMFYFGAYGVYHALPFIFQS